MKVRGRTTEQGRDQRIVVEAGGSLSQLCVTFPFLADHLPF